MYYAWKHERINIKLAYWGAPESGATSHIEALAEEIRELVEAGEAPEPGPEPTVGMQRNDRPVRVEDEGRIFTAFFCHPPEPAGEVAGHPVHYKCLAPEYEGEGGKNRAFETVLDGVTGVIFVADAQRERREANETAFRALVRKLARRHEVSTETTAAAAEALFGDGGPVELVVALNHSDQLRTVDADAFGAMMPLPESVAVIPTTAITGDGIYETFETMAKRLRPRIREAIERGRIPAAD